ncbi:pentatricopeptide repeat protein [Talaromyces stipitatus ATCC 10500]|uniref:Pentatricopeptide repeat protein n=1 Tax=Talaromyces stipitatus (strain ATCC 10500 / CBS 375.48 / QM 6759 / NRRL 1006) TaxID=441959 RepID=B8M8Q2_TALSN|nr:pentatricopeptide repeat protein [Talaromyces stipitatus ATCC 10500]EED20565.1 pentatricopeptide repeat protein [Talaromyces stipitatus ATCC 10500]
MHAAMLRSSNGFIRNLGTGARFGKRLQIDRRSRLGASSHTTYNISRNYSSYVPQPRSLDAENGEHFASIDAPPESEQARIPMRAVLRNMRLAESNNYNRKLKRKQRREVVGDKEDVDKLMELAKGKSLPAGVNSTVVSRELNWLKDPKELGIRIGILLQSDQVPLAVAMLRRAEAMKMETSAAWNRLFSYCFDRGAPLAAFRFYNDMKKRARAPTSHTYTIMLKGLCRKSRQSGVKPVELAYKIYRQLLDPDSDIEPTHHHYHAMLEVCGTYHDMETLWNVVGDLPEAGPHKPTAQTYGLILQALLDSCDNQLKEIPADQMELRKEKRETLILDAKRLWADVINQWRKGELALDGELVSIMAWVLIDPMDELNTYNALALYKQTMDIPILVPKPQNAPMKASKQGKWEAAVRLSKKREERENEYNYTSWQPLEEQVGNAEESEDILSAKEESSNTEDFVEDLEDVFDPVEEVNSEGGPSFLVPDNRVLHIILTVCRLLTKGTAPGRGYWNLFTLDRDGYNIKPDPGNFYAYLRLLRISRSSQTALDVIRQQMVPTGRLDGKALHIAMSCCLRDRTNPNVLLIAQSFLSLMQEHLPLPDPKPLMNFIELSTVLTENPQWLLVLRGLEDIDPNTTNLTIMGRNMRWSLQKKVITSLEPHANRLYESMEKVLDSPVKYYSTGSPNSPETINGYLALQFMVKFRELLDKVLGTQYADTMTKADRDWIAPLAIKLRKFSNPEVAKKVQSSVLRPLSHHYSYD